MLTEYNAAVLRREFAGSDYDGKSADQAWTWLMEPTVTTSEVDTHTRLTPGVAASLIGPTAANTLAGAIKSQLPYIADTLLSAGVDASDPETRGFLDALSGTALTADQVATLKATGKRTVTATEPRRFDRRFDPDRWPHVAPSGEAGNDEDTAITGFPNDLSRDEFNAAWIAAGRN